MAETIDKIRIDKWLWTARFFKTRSQATQAVQGGKVHLNGQRVKPSRTVSVGDELKINKLEQLFEVTIKASTAIVDLQKKRGSSMMSRKQALKIEKINRRCVA